ncbi:hypothetical protein GKE21_25765 [Escherichia coli]|nr:hypothetical protein [Escherichia coli]
MQDIRQETLNECTRAEQSASVVLWEIDLTEVGGERYFFCNEQNEKGEPVTLSVPRWEATALESFLAEHGGWKAFLWTPPYDWRQIKVICAKWTSRVSMLRVEFSAEFKQVVN